MQTCKSDVKSKSQVVGTAVYVEYDSVDEAVNDLGEVESLKLINAQVRTNALNKVRAAKTGKVSKAQLREMAFMELANDPQAMQECAGDQVKLQQLLDRKVNEIQQRLYQEDSEEEDEGGED